MRALISGISGFAGAHLAEHLLASGDEVMGFSLRGIWPKEIPASVTDHATIIPWDCRHAISPVTQQQVMKFAPDAIYHLAAMSVAGACGADEPNAEAVAVNVQGTEAVLGLVRTFARKPRLLMVSSCYVYAPVSSSDPRVSEGSEVGPPSGYGKSKLQAERLVQAAADMEQVDVVIARAFQHSGPRQSPLMIVPDFASQLTEPDNAKIRILCRDAYLDMSDVRDVVRAYRALVVDGKPQTVYNVGSGICQRSGDLLERLLKLAGGQRDVVEIQPGRRQHPVADLSRILSHTDWKPQFDIQQTLESVLEYWQQRNAAP